MEVKPHKRGMAGGIPIEVRKMKALTVTDPLQPNPFTDVTRNSFYVWGGYVPFDLSSDELADFSNLWMFIVDGEGGSFGARRHW
jgi:hypothetical protein